jgi:Flp pilus assembly protein TadD
MLTEGKGPMDQLTAHLDRGWDLLARGDLAGALVSAQKGLEIDGESPEAHNLVGYILAAEGNADEALDHYRQAIDLDETFVEAMLNAAEVLMHPVGDFDGALGMIEDALDLMEDDEEVADAMLLKVDVLLHQGDREAAARVVRTLPDGPFESPNLEFLVGRAKFEVGDAEGALPHIDAALAKHPDSSDACYYRALVLEQKGDARGAVVSFLQARELDLRMGPSPWSIPVDQFEKKVQVAIAALPRDLSDVLEGALVVVVDVPGAEVVADGVDPRLGVLLDAFSEDPPRAGRVFIYQQNIERIASGMLGVEQEITAALEREIRAVFAKLGESAA